MILFVYGMIGWVLFADELPEQWGNIGRLEFELAVGPERTPQGGGHQ